MVLNLPAPNVVKLRRRADQPSSTIDQAINGAPRLEAPDRCGASASPADCGNGHGGPTSGPGPCYRFSVRPSGTGWLTALACLWSADANGGCHEHFPQHCLEVQMHLIWLLVTLYRLKFARWRAERAGLHRPDLYALTGPCWAW